MTTEEKAQAYDEALKRAKILYNDKNEIGYANAESVLEEVFPLLKESKDEKIRKEIINYFAKGKEYLSLCSIGKDDILAWLEKQAEQKLPIEKLPSEMKTIGEGLGFTTQQECNDYNKMVTDFIMFDDNGKQKLVWNEEDEHRIKLLEALCEDKLFESVPNSTMYEEMEITIDWLNSLRPQPKQEWSKEDEKMIGRIRSIIEAYAFSQSAVDVNGDLCEKGYIDADNWLKSLKQRIGG